MAKISERVDGYVESKRGTWGKPLGEFLGSVISKGGQRFFEEMEPGVQDMMHDTLTKIADNPKTPPELREALGNSLRKADIWQSISGWIWYIVGWIPAILSSGSVPAELIRQSQEYVARTALLDPAQVIAAWRRDSTKFNKFFDDLRYTGYTDERIELLKFVTEVIPQAQDIIRFALREVYTPEIATKYGQFQDIPTDAYIDAAKAGLPKDTFDKFWAAHWYLPSSGEGFEMMHRGVITEDELKALLKANDIMPYWRDKLASISWNVPTRVDVRRFWEMRTIDEARLREIYTGLGYHGKDLEDYVLWTKIYVDFPTLLARYKNGWITLEDVKRELVAMGMKGAQADIMIEEKIKKEAPERVAAEKELTKAEIIKGVKLGVITRDEGIELLTYMGYDGEEANYIMTINIEASTGSPHSYQDFLDLTNKYRAATGKEVKPLTDELKKAGAELVRVTKDVEDLTRAVEKERAKLTLPEPLPPEATRSLRSLEAKLYKAQAELARVKEDYEQQVAAWRYST